MPMMRLTDAARAVEGTLAGEDRAFSAVSTDSRSAGEGALFIALRGERFDGHAFVGAARARGAAAAVVSPDGAPDRSFADFPVIVVPDTRAALIALAASWRARFAIPLVAVTGSNGKTTTKEMLSGILRAAFPDAVLSTEGNLNNDIGLPLTLLRLNEGHRAAIIEMGTNHPGEIALLTRIASPTAAVVTNAQRAHLEGLKTVAAVAAEKGSVYASMPPSGVCVINADDVYAPLWQEQSAERRILRFSLENRVDVSGHYAGGVPENTLSIDFEGKRTQVRLRVPGKHNAQNALCAAAAALAAGVGLNAVHEGLAAFAGVKRRLQTRAAVNGATLFDDTYNANPDSTRAGIDVLAKTRGRKMLVLGDMGEIGFYRTRFHEEIGAYAREKGIDALWTLGEASAFASRGFGEGGRHFAQADELTAALKTALDSNTSLLVKGSRFMRMERVADALAADTHGENHAA